MSKSKLGEEKYVWMTIIVGIALIIGSLIVEFNYVDAAYLVFLGTCFIRYVIINRKNKL